jgi:hypothetical protein
LTKQGKKDRALKSMPGKSCNDTSARRNAGRFFEGNIGFFGLARRLR